MSETVDRDAAASTRRMALVGIGAFIAIMLASAGILWAKVGTTVFFELIAAGIAYCL